MPRFIFIAFDQQMHHLLLSRSSPDRFRLATTLALTTIVLTIGILSARPDRLNAGEQPPVGTQVQRGAAADNSKFIAESRKTLKEVHEDLVKLHEAIRGLGDVRPKNDDVHAASEGEIASQTLTVESAKAKLKYFQLTREAAEMATREYEEGIFKAEKASAEGELKLAQHDLAQAQPQIKEAKQRLAKIKQTRGGSTTDLVNVWNHELGEITAQLVLKRSGFAVEQAQSKLKVLEEYDKVVRVKRLQSDVEKTRSDELAARATRELEAAKLTKLQRSRDIDNRVPLTDPQKRLMALLDHAIPLEEKLSEQLDRIEKNGQSGDVVRQEIADLTSQLQASIAKAQIDLAAAALARMKGTIHREAKRVALGGVSANSNRLWAFDEPPTPSNTPKGIVAKPSSFVTENRKTLAKLEEQFNALGSRVLAILVARNPSQVDYPNHHMTVMSAGADYENAKLTREVAEIAIVEYEEGIFKQDEAIAMGELKLAEFDLGRAGDMIEYAKGRLAQIKQASRGSAADLANEYAFEDKVLDSERRERIARLTVEKGRSKLKVLQDYTRPRRVKELHTAVETAKADELAKQARMELEKAKLKKFEEPIPNRERPIREERILTLLDKAIPIDERLHTKLAQAETDGAAGEALRKEVDDLTREFQALMERALAEEAAAAWARLKPSIHQAANQPAGTPPK